MLIGGSMKTLFLLIGIVLLPSAAIAYDAEEAKADLNSILEDTATIKVTGLHQQHEGRILILEQAANNVLTTIEEFGVISMKTFNSYQFLEVRFRYSSQFFEFIRTHQSEVTIVHLLETVDRVRKTLGLEELQKILHANLDQMRRTLALIVGDPTTPEETAKALVATYPALGDALSKSEDGDRPKGFEATKNFYYLFKETYPLLQELGGTGFPAALELMGLSEFLGEFCQA